MCNNNDDKRWWFIDNNINVSKQHLRGPYTVSQMAVLFDVGTLIDTTQVWKAPNGEWRSFKQANDLIKDMANIPIQQQQEEEEEEEYNKRLPLDKIPSNEIRQCKSCISAQRDGYCDLTYFWDRPTKMWLVWDEYETLCRNSGLIEGLIDKATNIKTTTTTIINNNTTTTKGRRAIIGSNNNNNTTTYIPLDDPEKEAKRKKRREYRERKKLKQQAGLWKCRVKDDNNNPNIYISGLPNDCTIDELYNIFKLAGIIKTDIESGKYKIKIYGLDDEDGIPRGDALISYQSVESVQIAINRYDNYEIRKDCKIHVAKASFGHNWDNDDNDMLSSSSSVVGNKLDINTLRIMANRNNKRRSKLLELRKKEIEALASWEDDEAGIDRAWKPIIVLKGMYTEDEAKSDNADEIYATIKEDIQYEISRFGYDIKKIVIIENSLDGYVCIKFKNMEQAQNYATHLSSNNLILKNSGRKASDMFFYDGRDLKSRPIMPAPTPSTSSVIDSIDNRDNNNDIIGDDNNDDDDAARERGESWEQFLGINKDENSSSDDDDEFIIHKE